MDKAITIQIIVENESTIFLDRFRISNREGAVGKKVQSDERERRGAEWKETYRARLGIKTGINKKT